MKVTLYSEPSIDGFIATKDHDTSWVFARDSGEFENFIKSQDVILMGKQTFVFAEQDGDFPYDGPKNIVFTSDKALLGRPKSDRYIFTNEAPKTIITQLQQQNYINIGVIGGGKLNGSMMSDGLINELILTYHPIVLGDGIRAFNGSGIVDDLEILSIKQFENNLFQVRYKIK